MNESNVRSLSTLTEPSKSFDSTTGRAANGLTVASAEGHAPMVNWDVVSHDWDGMKQRLREVAVDVERGWKRITG